MFPYIIAEIGFNHEGDLRKAKAMIHSAAEAGVSAVKFQTFRAGDIVLPSSPHYKMIERAEMNLETHQQLALISRECGIDFLSTPFSNWAVDILEKVNVLAYKVASMDLTNYTLLSYIAQTRKPIYLSTGMSTLAEIAASIDFLKGENVDSIYLLHCISYYPPKAEDLNLSAIPFMKRVFNLPVGYSDHFPGTKACFMAAVLGAEVIETHFTLDTSLPEGDHSHSASPLQLKQLVEDIEFIKQAVGKEDFFADRPDRDVVNQFRRGIYAAQDIESGTRLTQEHLIFCRPQTELSLLQMSWYEGRITRRSIKKYQALSVEDF